MGILPLSDISNRSGTNHISILVEKSMKHYGSVISSVREKTPLVHHITNYVTVNDCANITLCIGGSPVMAHAIEEVDEMVAIAGALVLNIGTLDVTQITQMVKAGKAARRKGIPIILDPVGAGATTLRTETARMLIEEVCPTIIKGNAGEIATLAGAEAEVRGVDSAGMSGDPVQITTHLAESLGCTVVMSGKRDLVSDGVRVLAIDNGHEMMGYISGTGCMAASIIGACSAVYDDCVVASAAGLAAFGIAGERAGDRTFGPGTFKYRLFDAVSSITAADIEQCAHIQSL